MTKAKPKPAPEPGPDAFVPDVQVRREFGVSSMAIHRWDKDKKLGFPPKIQIRGKNFRSRQALEAFKARLLDQAIQQRSASK